MNWRVVCPRAVLIVLSVMAALIMLRMGSTPRPKEPPVFILADGNMMAASLPHEAFASKWENAILIPASQLNPVEPGSKVVFRKVEFTVTKVVTQGGPWFNPTGVEDNSEVWREAMVKIYVKEDVSKYRR